MASQQSQPQDGADSGPGLHGPESESEQDSNLTVDNTLGALQNLKLSSADAHVLQELKLNIEIHGKAIAAQGERSKHFMAMIEQVLAMYQRSEDDKKKLEDNLGILSEGLRQKEITIQQLQATLALQETEVSRLQMDMLRLERTSYDGVMLIEIKDYSRKRNEARSGPTSFYTDEFYTDRRGYKMCSRIYLNGDGVGKGSHLSIFFAIKKGSYDNYLKWPFKQRVTFTLVNQDGKDDISDAFRPDSASSSFQKPRKEMNIASGCPMFVSHSVLENPSDGFLRNNTICLKVTVDPLTP